MIETSEDGCARLDREYSKIRRELMVYGRQCRGGKRFEPLSKVGGGSYLNKHQQGHWVRTTPRPKVSRDFSGLSYSDRVALVDPGENFKYQAEYFIYPEAGALAKSCLDIVCLPGKPDQIKLYVTLFGAIGAAR